MSIRPIALALGFLTAASCGAAAAPEDFAEKAEAGSPLSSGELYQIYNNRSWLWDQGGGFFSVKERRFTAWAGSGADASYGIGLWFITEPGKLCFRAKWHAREGAAPAVTCFSHRKNDGVIYQRREPDGDWYVFRDVPAKRSNEYAKLRKGDHVSARLKRIEARMSSDR
ncbi:DUF995 domain-containing protein [Chelativorans sp. M5D2P16]|uniref:DUF995 domain-containing protein n=1 Tax=Chelativorans sp. M5D2P16 TaxID=3095678 RepID=UPI002ACAFE8A|nr:DUF995 domain-containing protein [Chelativorans sp. M5D2P16]MDZ5698799.1 DUF995 domain-containing protein [Chelativorans sp. M5D2P16]